jgi:hypothetical protein
MAGRACQPDTGHGFLGLRVQPGLAIVLQHGAAAGEADWERFAVGSDRIGDEAIAIEVVRVAEGPAGRDADRGQDAQRDFRLLQRNKPFVRNAERPRALVGVVEPVEPLLADVLVEPDGLLWSGVFRKADIERLIERIRLAHTPRGHGNRNHGDRDENPIATHAPLPDPHFAAAKSIYGKINPRLLRRSQMRFALDVYQFRCQPIVASSRCRSIATPILSLKQILVCSTCTSIFGDEHAPSPKVAFPTLRFQACYRRHRIAVRRDDKRSYASRRAAAGAAGTVREAGAVTFGR